VCPPNGTRISYDIAEMKITKDAKYARLPESTSEAAQTGSLLQKWKRRKCVVSRICTLILLAAACILGLMLAWFLFAWLFSSSAPESALPPKLDLGPSLVPDKKPKDDGLHHKQKVTTISLGFDKQGKMTTETTTETTGIDADGNMVATKETKSGTGAEDEAEKVMSGLDKMLGGLGGLGALISSLMAPPKKTFEEELLEQMLGFPTAAQVLGRRQPMPISGLIGGLPLGEIFDHGHQHHPSNHVHSHSHGGHTHSKAGAGKALNPPTTPEVHVTPETPAAAAA